MTREPTPIIATRIPLALQAIFLASSRGETVNAPVDGHQPSLLFSRNWLTANGKKVSGGLRKSVSMEAFPISWEDDEDTMMETRTEDRPSRCFKSTQMVDRRISSTAKKTNQNRRSTRTSNGKLISFECTDSDAGSRACDKWGRIPNIDKTQSTHSHRGGGMRKSASMGTFFPLTIDDETCSQRTASYVARASTSAGTAAARNAAHSLVAGGVVWPTPFSSNDDDTIEYFPPIHSIDDDDNNIFGTNHDGGADDVGSFSVYDRGVNNNKITAFVPNRWSSSSSSNISTSFSSSSSPRNVMQPFPHDSDAIMEDNPIIVGGNYRNNKTDDQANNRDLSPFSPSRWDEGDECDLFPKMSMNRWSSSPSPPIELRTKKSVPPFDHCYNATTTSTTRNCLEVLPPSIPLRQGSQQWYDPTMKHRTSPPQKPHRIHHDLTAATNKRKLAPM